MLFKLSATNLKSVYLEVLLVPLRSMNTQTSKKFIFQKNLTKVDHY